MFWHEIARNRKMFWHEIAQNWKMFCGLLDFKKTDVEGLGGCGGVLYGGGVEELQIQRE